MPDEPQYPRHYNFSITSARLEWLKIIAKYLGVNLWDHGQPIRVLDFALSKIATLIQGGYLGK